MSTEEPRVTWPLHRWRQYSPDLKHRLMLAESWTTEAANFPASRAHATRSPFLIPEARCLLWFLTPKCVRIYRRIWGNGTRALSSAGMGSKLVIEFLPVYVRICLYACQCIFFQRTGHLEKAHSDYIYHCPSMKLLGREFVDYRHGFRSVCIY